MHPVALVILVMLVALWGGLGLAALGRGWMLPWQRGHQSARTTGLFFLGIAGLVTMNGLPDAVDLPGNLGYHLENWAIAPLLLSAALAGCLAWRDRRRAERRPAGDGEGATAIGGGPVDDRETGPGVGR